MDLRGWDCADVILFSADAYVDHPAFGAAVIGRLLEAEGLRVCIVPQPDWHGDFRDFKKLGRPRLFFGISPGCMDSMVNKYTAARRLRSEDAYSPDGRHDLRPEYPTIVYTDILRKLFPDVPIVLGGIEASLRRVMHYDYWQERFRPSILCDCDADLITYGMGEKPTLELVRRLNEAINDFHPLLYYDENGEASITREVLREVAKELLQTAWLMKKEDIPGGIKQDDIVLHSFEDCLREPKLHAENFRHIEEESNKIHAQRLLQATGNKWVVVNPPYPPLTSEELDQSFDLPYTRLPHPKYKGKRIPAYEMIKFSVTLHRGCFGGCAFCIKRGEGNHQNARLKRLPQRPWRAECQHVHDEGQTTGTLREVQTSIVHSSCCLSEPERRPSTIARHLPKCRCVARNQEKLHWKRCSLRYVAS